MNSKYRGLYFPIDKGNGEWSLFKTIDIVSICSQFKSITNRFDYYEIETDKGIIKFSFNGSVLNLEMNYEGDLIFTLDMREMYDYDDKGRFYEFSEENGLKIIQYKKFHANAIENLMFDEYLAIRTRFMVEKIMDWRSEHYSEDEKRKSNPTDLFIFDAFRVRCNGPGKVQVSFGETKDSAIKKLDSPGKEKYMAVKINTGDEIALAYNCCIKSMQDLKFEEFGNLGFYAGLPWFFQIWTRDEALSVKSLIDLGEYDLVKKILLKCISIIGSSGRIQNRWPPANLETADGTGWVFKRLHELIVAVKDKKAIEEYFSKNELQYILAQLKLSIEAQWKNTKDFLVMNKPLETWMDTSFEDDNRDGARIEIQALWLSTLSFSSYLSQELGVKKDYEFIEKETKKRVREGFFDGNLIKDGLNDTQIRPNIFLAYYAYPELFSKEEWEIGFDKALAALWLDWGGFSTIDKSSKLYSPSYTGEDNRSYHRGDSWFFLNNVAAICLFNVNNEKYKEKIEKLIDASTKDILYNGAVGRPSELSSASQLCAESSLLQLWSAGTYIEMINICKGVRS